MTTYVQADRHLVCHPRSAAFYLLLRLLPVSGKSDENRVQIVLPETSRPCNTEMLPRQSENREM